MSDWLVDTATVARMLGLSAETVRANAVRFGGMQPGGPRGEWRFDPDEVKQRVREMRPMAPAEKRARKRPGPRHKPRAASFPILPRPQRKETQQR
jgi:hypothetical protein